MTSFFVPFHLQTQFNLLDGANQMLETVAGTTGLDARRKSYAWLDVRTKSGEAREVPLTPLLKQTLHRLREQGGVTRISGFVFHKG